MDTQKLRQRILDLAIRGKLVPQDPNDEPASVLLDRIRAEKERLIAEGKIKRPKAKKSTDKSHYQQFTPPFSIPESWEWVRLGYIIDEPKYGTSSKSLSVGKMPVLRMSNITKDGKIDYSNLVYSDNESEIIEYQLKKGDILFNRTNSSDWVGKCALYDGELEAIYAGYLVRVRPILILSEYLILVMTSSYYRSWCHFVKTDAVNQSNINAQKLMSFMLPLPPLQEQKRICDNFFKISIPVKDISDSCNILFDIICLAKSKILDLAMQGKLVPQDPADEPAAEMLRRVNPKAKIITDNPQCRNLPLGWTLCQLRDLCSFLSRGKSPKYSETPNQYPVFAQKCNLKDGDISLSQARFLDEITISKWPDKYRLKEGDVLVNSTGTGTVGRTRLFKTEYLGHYPFVVPDSHVSVVRSLDDIDSTYIFYCIYCQEGQRHFAENLAGSTNQKELYIDVIGDMNIKLPPTNEQKRIVAKVNELYTVLDEIEASLRP